MKQTQYEWFRCLFVFIFIFCHAAHAASPLVIYGVEQGQRLTTSRPHAAGYLLQFNSFTNLHYATQYLAQLKRMTSQPIRITSTNYPPILYRVVCGPLKNAADVRLVSQQIMGAKQTAHTTTILSAPLLQNPTPLSTPTLSTPTLSTPTLSTPALSTPALSSVLYISESQGSIFLCPIEKNGNINTCTTLAPQSVHTENQPKSDLITYLVHSKQDTISVCSTHLDKTFHFCSQSGNRGAAFQQPEGIALNPNAHLAYVTNARNNRVSICPTNEKGKFGTCEYAHTLFNQPYGITVNAAYSRAYVSNIGNNTVSVCTLHSNGTWGDCFDSGNIGAPFSSPRFITLNGQETIAYISNDGNNSISACPVLKNGQFGSCATLPQVFKNPRDIALNTEETRAYVAQNHHQLSICPIDITGTWGACRHITVGHHQALHQLKDLLLVD